MKKILRGWVTVCIVVGCAFFVSQLIEIPTRSALRGYDNTFNYLWLRSAMVDGDWDFRNDLVACNTLTPYYRTAALALPLTPAGRIPNKYGIGWSVITLPFYLAADGIVILARWVGQGSLARDGFNPVYQICIYFGHAALGVLALILAVRTISFWLGVGDWAVAGVVTVWAASPLIYYQTVDIGMSHGAAFFSVTLCAYALVRAQQTTEACRRLWLLAGAGWGLAVTTRFELGPFGLFAAWGLYRLFRQGKSVVAPATLFFSGAAPFILLQMWAWRVVYGRWFVFSYGMEGESFHWGNPQLFQSLFSAWHGLFYWHPLLFLAAVGLVLWAWKRPGIAWVLLALTLVNIYVNAAWWCWWFGSSFGYRTCDAALLPLMAGMAWLFQSAPARWRVPLMSLAIAAGAWNFYVLLLYRAAAISRSEPVTWLQMIEGAAKLRAAMKF